MTIEDGIPSVADNIGKTVLFSGKSWKIVGINYLGDYDVERFEDRSDGRYRIESSCRLGLPKGNGHYAELIS